MIADNIILNSGSGGATAAADDVGGVLYQRVKLSIGTDGAAGDVSSDNPIPVSLSTGQVYLRTSTGGTVPASTTSGLTVRFAVSPTIELNTPTVVVNNATVNISSGTVDLASGASLHLTTPTGGNLPVDTASGLTVQFGSAQSVNATLQGGTATIGTVLGNNATVILSTGAIYLRTSTGGTLAANPSDGLSVYFNSTPTVALNTPTVALNTPTITLATEATLHLETSTGGVIPADTASGLTVKFGSNQGVDSTLQAGSATVGVVGLSSAVVVGAGAATIGFVNLTTQGNLVSGSSLKVSIQAGGGTGGTAQDDHAALTSGSTQFTPIGGKYSDGDTTIASGKGGYVRSTAYRALHTALYSPTGDPLTTGDQLKVVQTASDSSVHIQTSTGGVAPVDVTSGFKVNFVSGQPMILYTSTGGAIAADVTSGLAVNIKAGAYIPPEDGDTLTTGSGQFVPAGGIFQSPSQIDALTTGQGGFVELTEFRALHVYPVNSTGTPMTTDDTVKVTAQAGTATIGTVALGAGTATLGVVGLSSAVVLDAGTASIGFVGLTTAGNMVCADSVRVVLQTATGGAITADTASGLHVKANFSLATTDSIILHSPSGQSLTTDGVLKVTGSLSVGGATDEGTFASGSSTFNLGGGVFQTAPGDALTTGQYGIYGLTEFRAIRVHPENSSGVALTTGDSVKVALQAGTATIGSLGAGTATIGVVAVVSGVPLATTAGLFLRTTTGGALPADTASGLTVNFAATPSFILAQTATVELNTPTVVVDSFASLPTVAVATGLPVYVNRYPQTATNSTWGPICVTVTATTAVSLVANPGAGSFIYVTSIAVSNASDQTYIQIADGSTIRFGMVLASGGGGFVQNFDPPWRLTSNTSMNALLTTAAAHAIVNVHYYVGTS